MKLGASGPQKFNFSEEREKLFLGRPNSFDLSYSIVFIPSTIKHIYSLAMNVIN